MKQFKPFGQNELRQAEKLEDVTNYGVWHLGRRDHSVNELKLKLKRKTDNTEWIESSINYLISQGYLNDKRFVENYLKDSYDYKQFGPTKVKQELKQKGIDNELINSTMLELEYDYYDLAFKCLVKKCRQDIIDKKEHDKLTRFLLSRGFNFDMIRYAFDEYKSK
jgi:regulatory protein